MTLGAAQLGMPYGIANRSGQPGSEKAMALLAKAAEQGIACIDTSPVYGNSEEVIGRFIRKNPGHFAVATKLPSLASHGRQSEPSLKRLVEDHIRTSLRILGVDQIDYYLIHAEEDYAAYGRVLLDAMKSCALEGLLGKTGLSAYTPEIAQKALADGAEVLQIPCNLFDRRWEATGVLQQAISQGVTVFARSVFLQGFFFLPLEEVGKWHPNALPYLHQLQGIANEVGMGIQELALLYVLGLDGVSSLVIGMETEEQLLRNVAVLDFPPLATKIRGRIEEAFSEVPVEILNPSRWPER